MTYQPKPSLADVRRGAGNPYVVNFIRTLPDEFADSASGSAAPSTDTRGWQPRITDTDGDTAVLSGWGRDFASGGFTVDEYYWIGVTGSSTPFTNICRIGGPRSGQTGSGTDTYYMDFTNETFVVEGSSVAFPSSISTFTTFILRITIDFPNGTTRFRTSGPLGWDITVNSATRTFDEHYYAESTGAAEDLPLLRATARITASDSTL